MAQKRKQLLNYVLGRNSWNKTKGKLIVNYRKVKTPIINIKYSGHHLKGSFISQII